MLKIKSNSWEDVVTVKKTVINEKYCDKKKYAEYQKAGKGGKSPLRLGGRKGWGNLLLVEGRSNDNFGL